MAAENCMALLRQTVAARGQAAVAREIGYSASAVNQAVRGSYRGSLDRMLHRVAETYGSGTVKCPVLGEIPLRRCAEERKKAASATSPVRARLSVACRQCEKGGPNGV